uniref:Uncharacterized protein n=1 Tax=Romanomermis culicivorax TaxID=13658 RepID=A0A915HQS4_ROMCU
MRVNGARNDKPYSRAAAQPRRYVLAKRPRGYLAKFVIQPRGCLATTLPNLTQKSKIVVFLSIFDKLLTTDP